jgi:hypothetical protein
VTELSAPGDHPYLFIDAAKDFLSLDEAQEISTETLLTVLRDRTFSADDHRA